MRVGYRCERYAEDPKTFLEYNKPHSRQWDRNHKDRRNAITHRYKAKRRGAGGSYTAAEWEALKSRYGHKCLRCGKPESEDIVLTVDHIVPVSLGGISFIENIQPLCGPCNSAKRDRVIDYRPY